MGKIETSGYKRFWEMRQFEGMNPDGTKRSTEGFRDMVTGEFHTSSKGWNGEPPKLPSGTKNLTDTNKQYKENYIRIFGHE